jgi:vacuolar protein sorting-associated protein 3
VRRGNIACVADSRSYALLDVEHRLKIPLMAISSLDDSQPVGQIGHPQNIASSNDGGLLRSNSTAHNRPLSVPSHPHSHNRSSSLGAFISSVGRRQETRPPEDDLFREATPPPTSTTPKPPVEGVGKLLETVAVNGASAGTVAPGTPPRVATPKPIPVFLKPHIASPTAEEFLVVTGTEPLEPGIGMFVNLDGDPKGPTLEFERYPIEMVVDGGLTDLSSSRPSLGEDDDGYVLASMTKDFDGAPRHGLEIQRLDSEIANGDRQRFWLEPPSPPTAPIGIRSLMGSDETLFQGIIDKLCQKRFSPFNGGGLEASAFSLRSLDSRTAGSMERQSNERELFERHLESSDEEVLPPEWEEKRNRDEKEFVARLAKTNSRLAVWSGNQIWWAVRHPLLLQLEARLDAASEMLDRQAVFGILKSFHNRDARNELEFLSFSYLRQRAGLSLLTSFLNAKDDKGAFSDEDVRLLGDILVESSLDARVVLALVPGLRNEIVESRKGIWIFGGVRETAVRYLQNERVDTSSPAVNLLGTRVLQFLRRFLTAWRKKKGLASVPDESDVFRTVDAALLLILLELDQHSPKGMARSAKTPRGELNELVDRGVDCFDRAVTLLESYHRLYVLSRLYQSRKMAGEVLETWKRIIEGEDDEGGELQDGEHRVREYLAKINSQGLVQDYGLWLANRNPKLGAQVFAEDKGRVPQFDTHYAVALLREQAPGAVKYYLEHLVFNKGHAEYVNDLVAYYLDLVITDLLVNKPRRETLAGMYEAYRALKPPKPSYHEFLRANSGDDDEVWQGRLRLLQLLSGEHEYDSKSIRRQLRELHEDLLVPELIILDGREGRHEDAMRLLVHKLADYDTAVSYCIRGGSSLYSRPGRRDSMPSREKQARLFRALLDEFLQIETLKDRIEQTGALLARYGMFFDVQEVLYHIPDEWPVAVIGSYLIGALQRLVKERNEVLIVRGLSAVENFRVGYEVMDRQSERFEVEE